MNKLQQVKSLPYIIWVVLIGTLCSRLGTSMVIPYMTLFMVQQKQLAIYWPTLAVGVSYLLQSLSTIFGARFFQRFSPDQIIQNFSYFYAFIFVSLGMVFIYIHLQGLIVVITLLCFACIGMCRSFIETVGQALISEVVGFEQKTFVFSLRYFFINLGTMLGPVVGLALGVLNKNSAFFMTAGIVMIYALMFYYAKNQIPKCLEKTANTFSFRNVLIVLNQDGRLRNFLFASIFIYIGFSQMEVLFALFSYTYTKQHFVFVIMYAINGLTIVLLQIFLVGHCKKYNINSVLALGVVCLSSGLLVIAKASLQQVDFIYYIGAFIFTLGEIFTLALLGIYIDSIAPPDNRYTYFSVNNLGMLGRILGPILAGVLCHFCGLRLGMCGMAIITLIALIFILAANKARV